MYLFSAHFGGPTDVLIQFFLLSLLLIGGTIGLFKYLLKKSKK
ncbi:hypothetical protein [Mangrovibacillus cuniculi]|nr:hypothetical protein [Mangrovibacillus cuniculi]